MRLLERLFSSRAARIGIVLVWLVFGGLGGSFAARRRHAPHPAIAESAMEPVPEIPNAVR